MSQCVVGWDIGGAHVKAALLDSKGVVLDVFLQPCPLWKGIEFLNNAIAVINSQIVENECIHVITMTGELVDLFENRDQGVERIIQAVRANLVKKDIYIYAGTEGILPINTILPKYYESIASANWLASASLAASELTAGLFVDIGSTTTDILLLAEGKVQTIGLTDYQRLVSEELVYTGVVRTAVMAVAQKAKFKQKTMGLMSEYFSTMADVYRLTGELNEAHDHTETADGAAKTTLASAKRLSRMTGYDFFESDQELWVEFAEDLKKQQINRIKLACEKQITRNLLPNDFCLIGAGIGQFLVKQLANQFGVAYRDFSGIFQQSGGSTEISPADCAPAVAVAMLYLKRCQ